MIRFLSLIVLSTVCGVTFARQDSSSKAAIEKTENKMIAAYRRKDLDALKAITTSDFKVSEKGKVYDRAKWIEMTKQMLDVTEISSIGYSVQSFHADKNQAIVKSTTTVKGTISIEGVKKILSDISIDEETWVKQNGVWKFKMDKTISETTKLNGKPVSATP